MTNDCPIKDCKELEDIIYKLELIKTWLVTINERLDLLDEKLNLEP